MANFTPGIKWRQDWTSRAPFTQVAIIVSGGIEGCEDLSGRMLDHYRAISNQEMVWMEDDQFIFSCGILHIDS